MGQEMAETNKQRCDRRQKLVYWEGQIEQWTTSGLSASAYCREQGIALCQFKYWQERVSKGQTSLFVEVETTKFATYTPYRERTITLDTSQGIRITIQTHQLESDLKSIIRSIGTIVC